MNQTNSGAEELINEIKNALKSNGNRADYLEDRISGLEDRNLEIIQVEEQRN